MPTPDRYRNGTMTVEAMQVDPGDLGAVTAWVDGTCGHTAGGWLVFTTGQGPLRVRPGDWILRNRGGDFFTCRDGDFQALYSRAPQDAPP